MTDDRNLNGPSFSHQRKEGVLRDRIVNFNKIPTSSFNLHHSCLCLRRRSRKPPATARSIYESRGEYPGTSKLTPFDAASQRQYRGGTPHVQNCCYSICHIGQQ